MQWKANFPARLDYSISVQLIVKPLGSSLPILGTFDPVMESPTTFLGLRDTTLETKILMMRAMLR